MGARNGSSVIGTRVLITGACIGVARVTCVVHLGPLPVRKVHVLLELSYVSVPLTVRRAPRVAPVLLSVCVWVCWEGVITCRTTIVGVSTLCEYVREDVRAGPSAWPASYQHRVGASGDEFHVSPECMLWVPVWLLVLGAPERGAPVP